MYQNLKYSGFLLILSVLFFTACQQSSGEKTYGSIESALTPEMQISELQKQVADITHRNTQLHAEVVIARNNYNQVATGNVIIPKNVIIANDSTLAVKQDSLSNLFAEIPNQEEIKPQLDLALALGQVVSRRQMFALMMGAGTANNVEAKQPEEDNTGTNAQEAIKEADPQE